MIYDYELADIVNEAEQRGYDKGIDDFIKECDKFCGYYKGENKIITRDDMLMIAERLKGGSENDD